MYNTLYSTILEETRKRIGSKQKSIILQEQPKKRTRSDPSNAVAITYEPLVKDFILQLVTDNPQLCILTGCQALQDW